MVALGLRCGAQASHCSGFSSCGAWPLDAWASAGAAHRLHNTGSIVVTHGLGWSAARGIFWTRNQTCVPCTDRQIFIHWSTREVQSHLFLIPPEGSPDLHSKWEFLAFLNSDWKISLCIWKKIYPVWGLASCITDSWISDTTRSWYVNQACFWKS